MAEEEEVPWNKRRAGNQKQVNFGMYSGDYELLEQVCLYLGCSQAEAVRTGIRMLAGQLRVNREGPE